MLSLGFSLPCTKSIATKYNSWCFSRYTVAVALGGVRNLGKGCPARNQTVTESAFWYQSLAFSNLNLFQLLFLGDC